MSFGFGSEGIITRQHNLLNLNNTTYYWKCIVPLAWFVRLLVGWLVGPIGAPVVTQTLGRGGGGYVHAGLFDLVFKQTLSHNPCSVTERIGHAKVFEPSSCIH